MSLGAKGTCGTQQGPQSIGDTESPAFSLKLTRDVLRIKALALYYDTFRLGINECLLRISQGPGPVRGTREP